MVGLVVTAFIFIVIVLVIYIFFIKVTLKSIMKQLQANHFERQVNITLLNHDLIEMAKIINGGILHYQSEMIEIKRKEQLLKNSILNVSHDLRTPLTSIIGYLQILDTLNLNKEQSAILEIVLARSQELKQLISNFYELSIIETAGEAPTFETVDILKVLPSYLLEFTDEFEKKKMIPKIVTKSTKAEIYIDSFMMKRVFNNLISNAVRYGLDYLNIYLDIDDTVKIIFENKIADDSLDILNIFEKFYVGGSAGNEGTGLGLYIAKEFVHKMNGNIEAYIRDETFNIQLEFEKKVLV